MNFKVFTGVLSVLLLLLKQAKAVEELSCPNCSQLQSRNASTNVEDECHDYYNYVCTNSTIPSIRVSKRKKKPKISFARVSNMDIESDIPIDYSAVDDQTDTDLNEVTEKAVNKLFSRNLNYKSKILKLPKKLGKSWQTYAGINKTHADITLMNHTFTHLFSKQRNYFFDLSHKQAIRKAILQTFMHVYGFKTEVHKFTCDAKHVVWYNDTTPNVTIHIIEGQNLIGILPSATFGKEGDRILVIGAHYDTVYRNPGIDDNGSGSVLVLETARLMSEYKAKLNATIYFVLFDQEESGLDGSKAFVNDYFIPKIIDKQKAHYVGAFITDMVLQFDPTPGTQRIPSDFSYICPETKDWIMKNENKSDFVSIWIRDAESSLGKAFQEAWNETITDPFKLLYIRLPIASDARNVTPNHRYSSFYRSDHASFWSSALQHEHIETLPAVRISELGPFRGYQRQCYHQPCDNSIQLTETNLNFLANTINVLVKTIVKLSGEVNDEI